MLVSRSKQLQPIDWAMAALRAIAAEGVDALSVERLAASIGVTKGSFYWHFADRPALVAAATELWEEVGTKQVIEQLEALPDPVLRLRRLFELTFGDELMGPTDTALASEADDPVIGAIVRRVTATRVAYVESVFVELGFAPVAAAHRARLVYAAYLGHFSLVSAMPNDRFFGVGRARYLRDVLDALTS